MRERGTTKETLAGSLLLAHPAMRDPNFRRSVVLMSVHNADGAMGVVLNRPLRKRLGELSGDFALGPLADVPLYQGGPVQTDQLVLVAWESHPEGFRLHFGVDPAMAQQLVENGSAHIRGFLGYSGWSAGQLENEMQLRTWIVANVPEDLLNFSEEALWRTVLSREGVEWQLLANEPDHPELN
ncbi:YqgE/AlgH family protein [Opitutus sp. ER46]|uniref:YqgE/AlgH family protein n=1 Tax=Opitutus sp. ER46 TaxID=2161864 RepID=UPI000D324D38|nr:YqgE/AlgH family protein [Opitutus sp. ER46]PTX94545.1 YqgE/AlgH family protein [Opitutus sp. ER46]